MQELDRHRWTLASHRLWNLSLGKARTREPRQVEVPMGWPSRCQFLGLVADFCPRPEEQELHKGAGEVGTEC